MFLLGYFDVDCNETQSFNNCKHHRYRLGINWRGQTKSSQIPPEMAGHKSAVKRERGLVKYQSVNITKMTGKHISVGSGMISMTTSFLIELFLYLNQKNKIHAFPRPPGESKLKNHGLISYDGLILSPG